jgi:predicted RNA binding protein YcfA (HicA-like mRNA interferase family)
MERRLTMKFSELVRLLESNGFTLVRHKGSIRYYGKAGVPRLVRVDYHGPREVPTGTCHAILRAAGVPKPGTPPAPDEDTPDEEAEA